MSLFRNLGQTHIIFVLRNQQSNNYDYGKEKRTEEAFPSVH